jgi:hypothetical protein
MGTHILCLSVWRLSLSKVRAGAVSTEVLLKEPLQLKEGR